MRFVVDDDDVLLALQIAAHAPHHVAGRFAERVVLSLCQDALGQPRGIPALAQQKGVVIGDGDRSVPQALTQVRREDVEGPVIVGRIAGQEHAKTVANGDARGDNHERIAEACVLPVLEFVQGLPGDKHRHDDRLAAARGHLDGHARESPVVLGVSFGEGILDRGVAIFRGDFGDVDGGLDCLTLAEEQPPLALRIVPVIEEPACRARDGYVAAGAPGVSALSDAVDLCRFLDAILRPFGLEGLLCPALLRARDRHEVCAASAGLCDFVGDAVVVEPEVTRGGVEGGVEDWVFDRDGPATLDPSL
jgi:hypothetical protein